MPITALRCTLAPLGAILLLAACTASPDSHARSGTLATASSLQSAPMDPDDADPEQDMEQGMDDLDDPDDFDPAEHLRRQLARQPARRGSGGPVQACTLSGKITLMGVTEDIRDCMQSAGTYSVAEFQQACQGLANGLSHTGNAPATIQYSTRCPTPAQGSCRNFMNSGMDAFYYQRTELGSLPRSCTTAGGRWQAGG